MGRTRGTWAQLALWSTLALGTAGGALPSTGLHASAEIPGVEVDARGAEDNRSCPSDAPYR